jgi:hypothetical protein
LLWKILPYQAVSILVQPSFPLVVGLGKIPLRPENLINQRVPGEFLAAVASKGVNALAVRVEGGDNGRADSQRALVKCPENEGETASSFRHCNQDLTRGRADHGVHLVVSDTLVVIDFGRSLTVHVEIPACLLVRPQTPADGLVADRLDAFEFHPVADFRGT